MPLGFVERKVNQDANSHPSKRLSYYIREHKNKHSIAYIMGKGKDAKKAVKKEPAKTPKEKKAEKREKKRK